MIERWIKNELTRKRYRQFKKRKLAVVSVFVLIMLSFFSFTAPFWANNRPIILNYEGKTYFPVFINYHPEKFGIKDVLEMDYRELKMFGSNWAIWPLIKWNPFESNSKIDSYPGKPTSENLMGTDDRGRDVFSRLLYGFRYSIIYSLAVWFFCFFLGTIFGGLMGYFGGTFDFLSQRLVEILSTVPQFFLLIIAISIFRPNLFLLVVISCLFGWISISYYVRAEFLKNRNLEFVEAARSMGASIPRILFRHILPNSLGPIITFTPFVISSNIVALASLDYLGFGLNPPTPSWGELLNQAQSNFTIAWWLAVYPSFALFITLVMFGLIGEAIRDAMDPRL